MVRRQEYDWDEAKREANFTKHGVDFADAGGLDWNAALTIDHTRSGESRHLTYAPIANRLHAMVWMERANRIRIISLRRANNREIKRYAEETS